MGLFYFLHQINNMKLVIQKCDNKILFAKSLRQLHPIYKQLQLRDIIDLADKLPLIIERIESSPREILDLFGSFCEYTYSEDDKESAILLYESEEYKAAMEWYQTLSDEDKNKIDILISGSRPRG